MSLIIPNQKSMANIFLPNNWKPRFDQLPLWKYLNNGGTRAVEVAHRRWGKDDIALHYSAKASHKRIGNYWHMLPQYNQARKVVWNAVNPRTGKRRIDEAFPPQIRKSTNKQEMLIELQCGSIWQLVGSDNYNSYVGSPPLGIVLSEWAISNPMSWAFLAPILEENGGWALFIYTSRGNNHGRMTYEMALKDPDWFCQKLSADQTPVFNPKQLIRIRNEYVSIYGEELGTALYEQEYLCSFEGAVFGAYLAKQLREARQQGRLGEFPHIRNIEVDTFWDLGVDDSMSIWFMQPVGNKYYFIDYYESSGFGLEHYAKALFGELPGHEHRKKYKYGNHYMPHDAEIREMTSGEIARSRKQVSEDLGMKPVLVIPRARNMDLIIQVHIPAMRNILGNCYFDQSMCFQGISALENYRSEYDEEKKIFSNRPFHDWSCHAADAFRTFAVGYKAIKLLFPDL